MENLFEQIASRLESGEHVFFAAVVQHTNHSPGTAGSKMAVFQDGMTLGTIGGGVMERRVQELAAQALRDENFVTVREELVHRANDKRASGLICAGSQTNAYLRLAPDDARLVRRIASAQDSEPCWLLISEDGLSIGDVQTGTQPDPSESAKRRPWLYAEPLLNPRRLLILGGGHCALALSQSASQAGFHVIVADDRTDLNTLRDNISANCCLTVEDLTQAADRVPYPELTSVVAMGTDIASDIRSLTGALRRPFPFIGLMGAPAKISRVRHALRDAGFGQEDVSRITAPVGLHIGSRTPAEIAVSVTAQLIRRHRLTELAS